MNQTMRFEGKTAIVTGGAGGIGTAICQRLAGEGAFVVVTDTNSVNAEKVAADISANGGNAVAMPADISKENECTELIKKVFSLRGQIDVLVNNAAVNPVESELNLDFRFEKFNNESFQREFEVGLLGAVLCCKIFGRHMANNKKG